MCVGFRSTHHCCRLFCLLLAWRKELSLKKLILDFKLLYFLLLHTVDNRQWFGWVETFRILLAFLRQTVSGVLLQEGTELNPSDMLNHLHTLQSFPLKSSAAAITCSNAGHQNVLYSAGVKCKKDEGKYIAVFLRQLLSSSVYSCSVSEHVSSSVM